jgi:hypothetical protein
MRLADILAALPAEEFDQLVRRHVRPEEDLPRPLLCSALDGILRSFRFLHDFVLDRQPPTLAILMMLLDAPDFRLPQMGFREAVAAETDRICMLVRGGEILMAPLRN